jgi:branched-chain amino acid aminotransferase
MSWLVSIDGKVLPGAEARISVLDNGFVFGDGVYETMRTFGGRPLALERHLRRLRASAARLGIGIPETNEVLAGRLDDLMARSGNRESFVRLIVSRGVGDISYDFTRIEGPTIVLAVKPLQPIPESAYSGGVAVATVSVRRNHPQTLDPAIKSCNLLNNVLAIREAQSRGAEEAILLNLDGDVAEGASSNIFAVLAGAVVTPPEDAGILSGITREIVIELCPGLGLPVREERLTVEQLRGADEAFITSSVRDVLPISTLDGTPVGTGRAGPITTKLLGAFREYAHRHST